MRSQTKATIIIASIGDECLVDALNSIKEQTIPTTTYLICDGVEYHSKINTMLYDGHYGNIQYLKLPYNIGKDGYYMHRAIAGACHFINSEYILFLDNDNTIDQNHVESLIDTIEKNNLDWAYSLRKIIDKDGSFVCYDDCESLGKYANVNNQHHVDTSCFCLKREVAINTSWKFHGKYAQDRVFYGYLKQAYPNYGCSGKYSLNYRLGSNPGSPAKEFFIKGNEIMKLYHGENYMNIWRNE